jgi:hypothetical protein
MSLIPQPPLQAKHLTRDQYAMNHPAGRIGKRLMLRVADVMIRNGAVPVVLPDMLMPQVLVELTGKRWVQCSACKSSLCKYRAWAGQALILWESCLYGRAVHCKV